MRDEFKRHDIKEKLDKLWKNCWIIPDTTIFLEMHKYDENQLKKLIDIFNKLNENLWIPFQVYIEYYINFLRKIRENEVKTYNAIRDAINKIGRNEVEVEPYKRLISNEHSVRINKIENIRDNIMTIFKDKVGSPYSSQKLEDIHIDLKVRIRDKIPPALRYEDYGDLIIWYQIIEHAISTNRHIIFITGDTKDNWWSSTCNKNKEKIPRTELVDEISSKAGVDFYICNINEFIKYAGELLNEDVEDFIKNIEEEEDIKIFNKMFPIVTIFQTVETLRNMHNQYEYIINAISKTPEFRLYLEMLKSADTESVDICVERMEDIPGLATTYKIKNISVGEKYKIGEKEYKIGDKIAEREIDSIMRLKIPGLGFTYNCH